MPNVFPGTACIPLCARLVTATFATLLLFICTNLLVVSTAGYDVAELWVSPCYPPDGTLVLASNLLRTYPLVIALTIVYIGSAPDQVTVALPDLYHLV